MARVSVYDETKADRLLELIAGGSSIADACQRVGLKVGTVACWAVRDTPVGFRRRYFEAFSARVLLEADRILEITDSVEGSNSMPAVMAAKSMADRRAWLASRLLSEFNDRVMVEQKSAVEVTFTLPLKGSHDRLPGPDLRVIDGQATEVRDGAEGGGSDT
jgi:hypothetical protein